MIRRAVPGWLAAVLVQRWSGAEDARGIEAVGIGWWRVQPRGVFRTEPSDRLRRGCALAATVLVADDDADILRVIELNFRLEGFEVVTARDGPDALAKAAAVRPDLVLLDVQMPGIDAWGA